MGESALGLQLSRCASLAAACMPTIETYHSVTRCEGSVELSEWGSLAHKPSKSFSLHLRHRTERKRWSTTSSHWLQALPEQGGVPVLFNRSFRGFVPATHCAAPFSRSSAGPLQVLMSHSSRRYPSALTCTPSLS